MVPQTQNRHGEHLAENLFRSSRPLRRKAAAHSVAAPSSCWGPLHGHTYSKSMDQPGKVANPARGKLNREN